MLNSKNFELSKTAIKKVLRIVEHDSIISHSKNSAKILFDLLGKANRDRISLKIVREANLTLAAKKVLTPKEKNPKEKPQTHWAAINAAHKMQDKISESMIAEHIYNCARTFFQNSV